MKTTEEGFAPPVGRIPSGCSILTVKDNDRHTAVLVSWVQQASFEPLQLTVCVKQGRYSGELIDAAGKFLLNIVGEDPGPMFKQFGKGFGPDDKPFEGVDHEDTEYGAKLNGGIGFIGCTVNKKIPAGDHDIYLADVTAGDGDATPNPYVHLRKSGKSY